MRRKAFTLIELALVIAIIGIMVGGGFKVLAMQRTKADITKAKEHVKTTKGNVLGYAMEYVDLPTWAEFNMSLAPINSTDLNSSFFYFAAPELQNDIDVCSFKNTSLEVRVFDGSTPLRTIKDVAFVVADQSANKNIQTDAYKSGSTWIVNTYIGATQADDNGADYTNTNDTYDDIVDYVTLNQLQEEVDCKSNKLKVLNDSAIEGNTTKIYNKQIIAVNGTPFTDGGDSDSEADYKWCISSSDSNLRSNIDFNCNGNRLITPSCSTYFQCTSPAVKYKTSSSLGNGNYPITISVKDQSNEAVNKTLLIRITP